MSIDSGSFPPDVQEIIGRVAEECSAILGSNLVGLYVRGSLATGDFIEGYSDIDLLAVTERPVEEVEFDSLAAMHAEMARLPNPYAQEVEIAYVDRAAIRRFRPGLLHPSLGRDESLAWTEHRVNWILERWVVRERGITLFGPNPTELIDAISADSLRRAVRNRLSDWAESARSEPLPLRYTVETMCRALYTLQCGDLPGKPAAVAWAIRSLPKRWGSLVSRREGESSISQGELNSSSARIIEIEHRAPGFRALYQWYSKRSTECTRRFAESERS